MIRTVLNTALLGTLISLNAPAAGAADAKVYTCDVSPISPQKGQYALKYRLTIASNGAATLEGVRNSDVRVRQTANKMRANWRWRAFRFSSVTDTASGATKVNSRADGYTGTLRWEGTCR